MASLVMEQDEPVQDIERNAVAAEEDTRQAYAPHPFAFPLSQTLTSQQSQAAQDRCQVRGGRAQEAVGRSRVVCLCVKFNNISPSFPCSWWCFFLCVVIVIILAVVLAVTLSP
jgi:hypothetical protein